MRGVDDGLTGSRGLDGLAIFRAEAIAAADPPGLGRDHVTHPLGHRRPHDALESGQVGQQVRLGGPGGLDDNRQRLEPGLIGRQEELAERAHALAEHDRAALRAERAAIRHPDQQQAIFGRAKAVGRQDPVAHPGTQVGRDPHSRTAALQRLHEALRVGSALDGHADPEFLGQGVELAEIGDARRVGLRDDQRRVDRLGEREHAAPALEIGPEIVGAIRQHLLAELTQPVDDGVALSDLEARIERLGYFSRRDLRADGLHARDAEHVGPGERRGERQARDRRRRHADAPAEPDLLVCGSGANHA